MNPHIIAVLPEEVKGTGICSRIYTHTSNYIDSKTPELYLEYMYKKKGKNKKEMDKVIKAISQVSKNTPYVIDTNHVFFGFKSRKSTYDKHTRGFVNVRYVSHIEADKIILTTGEIIDTISQFKSLNDNKNIALIFLYKELAEYYYNSDANIRYLKGNVIYD